MKGAGFIRREFRSVRHAIRWHASKKPDSNYALIAVVISMVALLLSAASLYFQFFYASSETTIFISHTEWEMSDGKLGHGPRLGIIAVITNSGNRPSSITDMFVDADPVSNEFDRRDCSKPVRSVGVAWRKRFEGDAVRDAIAFPVPGNTIISTYLDFEALPKVTPNGTPPKDGVYLNWICLTVETVNRKSLRQLHYIPLGIVKYTTERILQDPDEKQKVLKIAD